MQQGQVLDNMYFDDHLVAAYYYAKKYKIQVIPFGINRDLRVESSDVNGMILRVPVSKEKVIYKI